MKYWFQFGGKKISETVSYVHLMKILEGSDLEP